MTLIKICGITNLEDARAAVDAGADALGFNFFSGSPRHISTEKAEQIIRQLPRKILKVGVFVNVETPQLVNKIARASGVDAVQLHGDESPEYCRQLASSYVIKVFAVGSDFNVEQVTRYEVDAIMLDARDPKVHGGTGRVIDWSIAQQVRQGVAKLILAGGLSPENVKDAISFVKPYGVDACSALEDFPGRKNHGRMREFVNAVRDVAP